MPYFTTNIQHAQFFVLRAVQVYTLPIPRIRIAMFNFHNSTLVANQCTEFTAVILILHPTLVNSTQICKYK